MNLRVEIFLLNLFILPFLGDFFFLIGKYKSVLKEIGIQGVYKEIVPLGAIESISQLV